MEELFAIEIFAGSGRLTCELRKVGLGDSVGVGHQVGKCLIAPIIKLDLQDPEAQKLLHDMLHNPNCIYVHLAPPCGTASRARTIPQGRNAPEPARSDVHPDGLPGLESNLQARVKSANFLYQISGHIFAQCWARGVFCCCENPGRSFMWDTSFSRLAILNPYILCSTTACGEAPDASSLAWNQLGVLCCAEGEHHVHEPWGRLEAGGWATSQETAYPVELCRGWSRAILDQLLAVSRNPRTSSPPGPHCIAKLRGPQALSRANVFHRL